MIHVYQEITGLRQSRGDIGQNNVRGGNRTVVCGGKEVTRGKGGEIIIRKGLLIVELKMLGNKTGSRLEPDPGEEGATNTFDIT